MKRQRWKRALVRRRLLVSVLLVVQAAFLFYLVYSTSSTSDILSTSLAFVSMATALYIIGKPGEPNSKLTWIFLILLIPVFGGLFYLFYSFQRGTKKARRLMLKRSDALRPLFHLPNAHSPGPSFAGICAPLLRYMHACGYPAYADTHTEYLSPGPNFHARLLKELKKAQRYIFLEFFIVQEGRMWGSILDILEHKAKEGVLVRMLYDDVGCFLTLPSNYNKILQSKGIECHKFQPFRPLLSSMQNQRDHRKILVIDGKVAFTGGINLADEYIQVFEKYGYWHDAGICIKGKAAWSLTLAFLQLWNYYTDIDLEAVRSLCPAFDTPLQPVGDGLVQPYADNPMDTERITHSVYLRIIQDAERYVYIQTPYLIIDDFLLGALSLCAKSGVDVRIITPHVPDKPFIQHASRSYYAELINAGVKIYEFTPGFMHAKILIADDHIASVGTANLDYRSLYQHFECGCLLYDAACIADIKADFVAVIQRSHLVTLEACRRNFCNRIGQEILRLFAPLM